MSPETRRIVVPLLVGGIALLILLTYMLPRLGETPEEHAINDEPTDTEELVEDEPDVRSEVPPDELAPEVSDDSRDDVSELPPTLPEEPDEVDEPAELRDPDVEPVSLEGLRAIAPEEGNVDPEVAPQTLGSLDPREAPMLLEFTRSGAGIKRITLSDEWLTAAAKRQAEAHYAALEAGDAAPPPLPSDELRYVIKEAQPLHDQLIPALSSQFILVNNQRVWLFDVSRDEDGYAIVENDQRTPAWSETAPGRFESLIVNKDGTPILRVMRQFRFDEWGDMMLQQRIENLVEQALEIQWQQYGPSDMVMDRARYFDRRRFRFGYLLSEERDPSRRIVRADDNSLILERRTVFNRFDPQTHLHLWPNRTSEEEGYVLSWFGTNNRYFALVVHPVLENGRGDLSLTDVVEEILYQPSHRHDADRAVIFTYLYSPHRIVDPGEELKLDLGVYAGPMDRNILGMVEPYASLGMDGLILYQMSTWCAICTFQWLAQFLLWLLSFLHDYMLFDWGVAIIALVVIVRALLHPLTKKSQINMMRFGKQMQKIKPEIERLQKKYSDNTKESKQKMQQEQVKLFREHGINPFQILGCLPMFLQIPIWIALYAMLYFAIEIRHEPAFFGFFQLFWDWPFLGDLSSGDHFFGEFEEPKQFFGFWNITGINVLPILMGVVLFIHQKYMTPPTSATMTPEQQQQQKIMRVMMVTMLPVVLYNAPAGLTLYILTSSSIGIIESRYIRSHVDQLDLEPKKDETPAWAKKKKKKKKPRDPQARAYGESVDRMREKGKRKKQKPKSFKKRK